MVQIWSHAVSLAFLLTFTRCTVTMPVDENEGRLADIENTYELAEDPELFENMKKRLSSFVRIGRGLSSFIRIGKSYPMDGLVTETDDDGTGSDVMDKRKSAFVRIGKDGLDYDVPEKRLSSFVRIGRDSDQFPLAEKRGGAFIRMGKFPSSAFLRGRNSVLRGYDPSDYYRRTGRIGHSSFIRIGKRDTSDALKQMASEQARYDRYIRLGKEIEAQGIPLDQLSGEDMKRMSSFVRIGKSYGFRPFEQYNGLADLRIEGPEQKRLSSFVRIGKSDSNDKRMGSKFVRIGKSTAEDQAPIEIITKTGTASETE